MAFSYDYAASSSSSSSTNAQWQVTPTSIVQQKALIGALICIGANTLVSLALNVQKKAHQQQEAEDNGDDDDGEGGDEEDGLPQRSTSGDAAQQQQSQGQHTQTTGYGGTTNREGAAARRQQSRSNGNDEGQHRRSDSNQSGSGGGNSGGPNAKFLRSRLWWLGFALMTTGEAGNFISYGFAPASLVAPLGSVALLANVFIAPVMLKERFATSDLLGVLLASLGAAGVVAAAATDGGGGGDLGGTPDALWQAMTQTIFEVYAGIMAVLGGLLAWLSSTSAGDKYILVDVGACAVFGGFTVLATKGVSSLISHAASGGDFGLVLRSPLSYALVVVLVGTALVQIAMLNRALQRFDARSVIPSQFVFFTISAISGSAVLFRDFERASAGRVLGFVAGCLTTFAGVFVLTRRKDGENGDDDDEGQDGDAQGTSSARGRRSLRRRQKGRSRASSSVVVDEERQALLPVGPKSPDNAQAPPTGPLATMSTGSKAATNTSQTVAQTSSGGSTSAAIPRPVLPNPRSSRTPRLSLVGGSAMGGGGYLLLASPSSSWSSRGVGALSTATGAGAASTSAVAQGPSKTRRASGPSSAGTSGMTKISGSDVERGSKSVDTWRRDGPARRASERSGDGEQDHQATTTAANDAAAPSASHDARIAANEERRRQDPRSSDVPAMPLNLPANFGSTGNSATPPAAAGAESSFRSQLSGFRWAQGSNDDSASRAQPASTGGSSLLPSWMSSSSSTAPAPAATPASGSSWLSSYVPLRSSTRPDSEEASLSLSHWDRLLAFLACLAGSFVCFLFSFLFLLSPLPKLRKFALSFSLGSMLFMVGFAVLVGPLNHLRHMASRERAPFSIAYVGSLLATLYFALGPRVTLPTLLAGVVQVGALLAYLAAYFPGGTTTLRYAAQWAARGMGGWLPL